MTDVLLLFPPLPDQPRCKVCGFVLEMFDGEPKREKCFCCEHNIPLPLFAEAPCEACGGTGWVRLPVVRQSPPHEVVGGRTEPCAACLGAGMKK